MSEPVNPRERMTERITRTRLELEVSRASRPALVLIACGVLGLLAVAYAVVQMTPLGLGGTTTAKFALADATAVRAGIHEVRFKGVPVGTITSVQFEDEQPVATVRIRGNAGVLYGDVRAQLRPATALQDMYLDIVDRGDAGAGKLEPGQVVPAAQTQMPVNIDDVLNTLRPSVRAHMQTLLAELGGGLDGRGRALEAVFVRAVPLVRSVGRISAALRERAPLVRELVHSSRLLADELANREATLRRFVTTSSAALETVGGRQAELDAFLRELPPVLRGAHTSLTAVDRVVGDVDHAVTSLRPAVRELRPSLDAVERLSNAAGPAVRALRPAADNLTPLMGVLAPIADELQDGVDKLRGQAPVVNKVTLGADRCEDGIRGFFQWNVSISKLGDARAAIPRGNVVLGAQSSSVLNDPQEYAPQACSGGRPIGGRVPEKKDER